MPSAMANRLENAKSADKGAAKEAPQAAAAAGAPAAESGGIKPFIPLLANLILMPVLAYAMTALVLVPKLAKKSHPDAAVESAAPAHGEESSHGGKSEGGSATDANGKIKYSVPLSKKTLVNVSGTMGTRYLLAEFILVGNSASLKTQVEKNDAKLRDRAGGARAHQQSPRGPGEPVHSNSGAQGVNQIFQFVSRKGRCFENFPH